MAKTNSELAYQRLGLLRGMGYSDTDILEHVMRHVNGDQALEIIDDYAIDNDFDFED
ncbi:hypothetical protein [Paenibacillus sp. Mc5Re-14]|uniref:hypothetical protein n=1 Tax=Paenibacillus sp. Mc5Re-14 TaxID=1030529 RepID=UPI000AE63399|nr:hypothetical protein [Paenibacillus sp. Mc5Re-14]